MTPEEPAVFVARIESGATRATTPCGGGSMVWRIWGEGRPLLLLHGASGSWTHWIRNIRPLAARFRVLVPDMPGFGDSDTPPEPHTADRLADLVASGVGTVSTAAVPSTEYSKCLVAHPSCLAGGFSGDKAPYMTLTGTSMAAPVVSGTVALMLQANPKLTPNLVKAILMYTAEVYRGFRPLEQGAGFLNSLGAVRLARFYKTARKGARVPVEPIWSKQFFWGNHRITGGIMVPDANAWDRKIVWGAVKTLGDDGDNIVWGTSCGSSDCGDNIVWGTADGDNIVWGTDDGDNIVWGTSADGDNIVWGTDCGGADCGGNIVWGTAGDGDNIVWGTGSDGDNIVSGTGSDGDNIVWGTADGDNIVWGTALRGRSWRKTPLLSPSLSFEWFLDPRNDGAWIMQEFGDALMVRGAKP